MIPSDLLSRSLVIGAIPERLVAFPEPLLEAFLAGRRADGEALTFGEFRTAAPAFARLAEDDDDAPPTDDEPFHSFADRDAFPYAEALMLDWVPADLQAELGEDESDTYGDEWLQIGIDGPDDAEAIGRAVRLFEAAGYTVRRDDSAVAVACGYAFAEPDDRDLTVVLGEIPHGLVALPLRVARRRVELEVALAGASTWGEAYALLAPGEQDALAEAFEESPDDEPFALSEVWGLDDGEWPGWLPRDAVDEAWFPASVVALGKVHETTHSGPYLAFDPADRERVAVAFRAEGYTVTDNEALVDAACGGYNGTTAQEALSDA